MCAALLKHNPPPQRGPFAWFNRQVDRVTRGFGHAVEFVIKRMVVAFVLLVGVLGYVVWAGAPALAGGAYGSVYELRQFAASFLKEYWLHFELTSVLLVVAVVAAVAVIQVHRGRHD